MITAQFTPILPASCVEHAHLQEQTTRISLAIEQICGHLSSDKLC